MAEPPQLENGEEPLDDGPPGEKRMAFLDHLGELRTCLRNSAIAVLIATGVAYAFKELLYVVLARPMMEAWEAVQESAGLGPPRFVFTSATEAFMVYFKISLASGVLLASPFIFREIWRFISPGLYPRERRWGIGFVLASMILFVGGAAFAYKFVLPAGFKYFLGYAGHNIGSLKELLAKYFHFKISMPAFEITPMLSMDEYLGLTSMLLLVFGGVFELPLVLTILALLGIVSAGQLWRFNRYAIILFSVAGAVLTPGDLVVGQLAMTGALTVLYNLSIVLTVIFHRSRKEENEAEAAAA